MSPRGVVGPLVAVLALLPACSWWIGDDDITDWERAHQDSEAPEAPQVDVLLLLDTSPSMQNPDIVQPLTQLPTLLDGWDYQIGITSLSVDYASAGPTDAVDLGEAGTLAAGTVVSSGTDAAQYKFYTLLLCSSVCFEEGALADDPSQKCSDLSYEVPEEISTQYLDCLCGSDTWQNHCGAGTEEGLEALTLRLCLEQDDPGELCTTALSPFDEAQSANRPSDDLFREGVPTVALLVSDEGDTSRELENGDDSLGPYADFMGGFPELSVSVIGPDYDQDAGSFGCNNGGAVSWGTVRYQRLAEQTGGAYWALADEDDDCAVSDLDAYLDTLVEGL